MLKLTRRGLCFSGTREDVQRLREEFNRQNYILFHDLFEPELFHMLSKRIEQSSFYERTHEGIGFELCLEDATTRTIFLFVMNNHELFRFVEEITGCAQIGCFSGRVYRLLPDSNTYDSWHNDMGDTRLVAMSVNFSTNIYEGGTLQIRDRYSHQILQEVANTGFNDAILFRLDKRLEHRITDVTGAAAKTAFAGWFQEEPDYRTIAMGNPDAVSVST